MYKTLTVTVTGIAPLIMHNGRLSNPLDGYTIQLKEISGKKKKTEADYEQMARIEFVASLYMDEDGPVIPDRMIEACLLQGARKSKNGKLVQAGVIVEKHAKLEYSGPRTASELYADERFKRADSVRVQAARVTRTRPVFQSWSAELEIQYLHEVINRADLMTAIRDAGAYAGFGDWRPRHGRFALAAEVAAQLPRAA